MWEPLCQSLLLWLVFPYYSIYIALFAAKERLHDFYHCSPVLKTMRTLMLTETANSHTNRDIRNYITRLLHMTRMAKVEEVRQAWGPHELLEAILIISRYLVKNFRPACNLAYWTKPLRLSVTEQRARFAYWFWTGLSWVLLPTGTRNEIPCETYQNQPLVDDAKGLWILRSSFSVVSCPLYGMVGLDESEWAWNSNKVISLYFIAFLLIELGKMLPHWKTKASIQCE